MQKIFLIGLAGLVGTLGRYGLSGIVERRLGETFPAGTLVVNLIGCFVAGLLFYLFQERVPASQTMRAAVMIGFLGGFTTFSAFGLQTFTLLKQGQLGFALINVAASNVFGLLMVWAGYSLAKVV